MKIFVEMGNERKIILQPWTKVNTKDITESIRYKFNLQAGHSQKMEVKIEDTCVTLDDDTIELMKEEKQAKIKLFPNR